VIVRETTAAAWAAADELIRHLMTDAIAAAQTAFARFDSEGQRRMSALHGGRRDKLEVSPNLWAGVGLVRGGAGTALVGDPDTVAERMNEYAALGIDTFILSGYPHLEEAIGSPSSCSHGSPSPSAPAPRRPTSPDPSGRCWPTTSRASGAGLTDSDPGARGA
jgi:hypothetical protein